MPRSIRRTRSGIATATPISARAGTKRRDGWDARAANLAGLRVVTHHRSFSYLADWIDLDVVATLEPKPGVPPSGAQLAKLLEQLQSDPPAAIVRAPFENEKPSQWLSTRLSVPVVILPYTVDGDDAATDLFTLFDDTLNLLEGIAQ